MARMTAAELEIGLGEVRDRLNIVASATTPNATELFQALVVAVERLMETSVRFAKHTEEMVRQTADEVTAARLDNLTGISGIQSRITKEVSQINESLNKIVVQKAASRFNYCVALKVEYTQMIPVDMDFLYHSLQTPFCMVLILLMDVHLTLIFHSSFVCSHSLWH